MGITSVFLVFPFSGSWKSSPSQATGWGRKGPGPWIWKEGYHLSGRNASRSPFFIPGAQLHLYRGAGWKDNVWHWV